MGDAEIGGDQGRVHLIGGQAAEIRGLIPSIRKSGASVRHNRLCPQIWSAHDGVSDDNVDENLWARG